MAKKSKEEQIEQLKLWLKHHANQLFLAGMALLLAGRLYFFWDESNFAIGALAKPQEVPKIDSKIDESTAAYKNVVKMINMMPEFPSAPYYRLSQFNMFDPRTVLSADTNVVIPSNRAVDQAQVAFKNGDTTQARTLLDRALQLNPSNRNALKLQADIAAAATAQKNSATSATATK